MKKIYSLLLLVMTSVSFGQATDLYFSKYGEGSSNNKFLEIYNGTGAPVDLADYSIELYANGAVAATNTQIFTAGTIIAAGDVYVLRNGSAANAAIVAAADITSSTCNFNGDDAIVLKKLGSILDVIGQVGVDPGTAWAVGATASGTLDHTLIRKLTVCSPNATNLASFGTDDATSEWTVYGIDAELGQLGAHVGCSTSPSLIISSPANNTILSPETTSVNINVTVNNFTVANGTGNGHIHYTINSGSVIMKYDTTPIVLPTTPGTYVVYMQLVDNAHNPIVPAVNATTTFTVAAYSVVADLAALRADAIANGAGRYYQVNSNPVITYARTTRNQKYIQDSSAAVLVDDNTAIIATPMVAGDAISGLKGQTSLFSGVLQLLPTVNATLASSGNVVTPQTVTIADLLANVETYESELVQLSNASFTTADGTLPFTSNANFNLNDGSGDVAFRTLFAEANYIGQVVPSGPNNMAVLVAEFNTAVQVVARSLSDLTLSNNGFEINDLKVYPNPVSNGTLFIETAANAEKTVTVYDILGKQVLNTTTSDNAINVSNLRGGVYVVKITEEGKTATRKLVVN
ncbi:T9SS type A sorting domain-containing protein [Flavobacterium sp. UBA7682]|uniref:T9SS type A sorting domain-containing protein n=1 Tax=Flavobacterium sp. UBA7682 TaxID=1946560 RepID=UPI0025C4C52F|nr:T9SS type A sorting domain-containing protein [Flavobacterium sp. UBA7682]